MTRTAATGRAWPLCSREKGEHMKVELLKWNEAFKRDLMYICNNVDRTYLSDRMPFPYTDSDAEWWLDMVSEQDGKEGLFRAVAADGRIVGNITVELKRDVYRIDGELGYLLLTEYWSQGIMTEAAALMCREAFENLGIERLTSKVYAENVASRRVLEKNGFVTEGVMRSGALKDGKLYDVYVYGKLKENKTAISVDAMRRSDAYTIRNLVPSKELMYRAAYGVFRSYDGWRGSRIAILAGGGNNGGDGYALAGILKNNGFDSVIYKVSDKMSEDGRYYCDVALDLGVPVVDFDDKTDLSDYDVIADCILGTGFRGEVRGKAADAIRAVNESGAYVISVDINSGMNGDTGEAVLAVRSDLTVSIGYYKQGLFRGDCEEYIGNLVNVDIGIILTE